MTQTNSKLPKDLQEQRDALIRYLVEQRPDLSYQDIALMFRLKGRASVWWIVHQPRLRASKNNRQ